MGQNAFIACRRCGKHFDSSEGVSRQVLSFYGDGVTAGMFTSFFCSRECSDKEANDGHKAFAEKYLSGPANPGPIKIRKTTQVKP